MRFRSPHAQVRFKHFRFLKIAFNRYVCGLGRHSCGQNMDLKRKEKFPFSNENHFVSVDRSFDLSQRKECVTTATLPHSPLPPPSKKKSSMLLCVGENNIVGVYGGVQGSPLLNVKNPKSWRPLSLWIKKMTIKIALLVKFSIFLSSTG